MLPQTIAREHEQARTSAFYAVSRNSPVRLADVVRISGLVEIRAQRALKELVDQKFIRKSGNFFVF
jgi:hypothetical protein